MLSLTIYKGSEVLHRLNGAFLLFGHVDMGKSAYRSFENHRRHFYKPYFQWRTPERNFGQDSDSEPVDFLTEIPQYMYTMPGHRMPTYVGEPISFRVKHNSRIAVNLSDALHDNLSQLVDAKEPIQQTLDSKMSYRIKWKGYRSYSTLKQPQCRRRRTHEALTRADIAVHVASVMQDFINEKRHYMEHPYLRVGRGFIELENIFLIELRRVSKNSWQPILAYGIRATLAMSTYWSFASVHNTKSHARRKKADLHLNSLQTPSR